MFTPQELSILRQALDTITLLGKDAKYIASIQIKIEQELDKTVQSTHLTTEKSTTKK
jgi:hypothetical protein